MRSKSGQKAANRGLASQAVFIDSVNLDPYFNKRLKKAINLPEETRLAAYKPSTTIEKSDAILIISPGRNAGCSIKEAQANFNQLERIWLKDLALAIKMPKSIEDALQACIDNKRLKISKIFISQQYTIPIIDYFKQNADVILNKLFTRGDPSVKYLVVYDFNNKKWCLSEITDVIACIKTQQISISSRGILYFGDCLTMQRKAGNGARVKVPKSHPNHPGNQLQFKVKPLSMIKTMPSFRVI